MGSRHLMCLAMAVMVQPIVLVVGPRNAEAQAVATTPRNDTLSQVSRWITTPTRIELSAGQRATIDSLRRSFDSVWKNLQRNRQDEIERLIAARRLTTEYSAKIRILLTAPQQTIFDRNVRFDTTVRPEWL